MYSYDFGKGFYMINDFGSNYINIYICKITKSGIYAYTYTYTYRLDRFL